MKKLVLGAVVLALSSGSAFAASGNTSTATGAASAVVVAPIVLTHTTGAALNFGRFTVGTGGSVDVSAAGVGSVGSDVGFVPGSTVSADAFTVAGDASRSFSITTTGGSVTAGSVSMPFTTTPSAATATLSSGGTASFTVGGTLTVASTVTAGSYTGSYTATVTYN
ncbi:DUF4402 domain-containing protein [Novosphingobium cyanobacteriorum]|uniref:DUF4402 domain-containing protein n=1 Tax=Novosphingobium cyanobacteriorum TaxID=3024215 RepID=A0ABT6CNF7_9SPHN|nr:DUF4402 domain-containing protein [Novosphingobium cyanobacteriorum]MDF8334620.1 DUF4402 domain-containing protein [Novosphingobium cyanobacteriorum]